MFRGLFKKIKSLMSLDTRESNKDMQILDNKPAYDPVVFRKTYNIKKQFSESSNRSGAGRTQLDRTGLAFGQSKTFHITGASGIRKQRSKE